MNPQTQTPNQAGLAARLGVLLYGSVIYTFFLATFLYAIGFVSGWLVPKTVDKGGVTDAPLVEALLINGGFLALFAIQHIVMARRGFKRWWTRIVPAPMERSTFVLATCLILCGMYLFWRPMTGTVWHVANPAVALGLEILSGAGWALVLLATFLIDHFDLFGLKQVIRFARGKTHQDPRFQVKSLYKYTRHPLYLGFLTAFWATPHMTQGHLFFSIMCTGFILFAVRLEERDLIAAHGENYTRYRKFVPMLFPRPGKKYPAAA